MVSFCDKLVTFLSGLASLTILIYVAQLEVSKSSNSSTKSENLTQPVNSTRNNSFCNMTNPLIEVAKEFDQVLEDKDLLQRIAHRLTHRQEAIHAALSLIFISVMVLVALLVTKMWKEKDHHGLTFKQTVKFPQMDDPRSQIRFKNIWKTKGHKLMSIWRVGKRHPEDQTDAAVVQLPRLSSESSEDEGGGVLMHDPNTGEWTSRPPPPKQDNRVSFSRTLRKKLKVVKVEKPSFSAGFRRDGRGTVSLINDDETDEESL